MTDDTCAICTGTPYQSSGFDHDLRTLRLRNGYKLDEGSHRLLLRGDLYEVTTCKECRGDFIALLWGWVEGALLPDRASDDDPERNIPVRREGRTVMMTRAEWDAMRSEP